MLLDVGEVRKAVVLRGVEYIAVGYSIAVAGVASSSKAGIGYGLEVAFPGKLSAFELIDNARVGDCMGVVRVVVSPVSRFGFPNLDTFVRVAPLPAAFLAFLPYSRKLWDRVMSLRAYGLGRTLIGPTLAPPSCGCVLTCTRA